MATTTATASKTTSQTPAKLAAHLDAVRYRPTGSVVVTRDGIDAVAYVHTFTSSSGQERYTAIVYSGKATRNADWNYAFKSAAERDSYIAGWFDKLAGRAAIKQERKAARKALADQPNPFKVGDILHYSWGYDQTNAEFYQVTEVKAKTVTIREIASRAVPNSQGFMSERVRPVKDAFLKDAEPMTKRVQFEENGRAYLSMEFGIADLAGDRDHYSSWYA